MKQVLLDTLLKLFICRKKYTTPALVECVDLFAVLGVDTNDGEMKYEDDDGGFTPSDPDDLE